MIIELLTKHYIGPIGSKSSNIVNFMYVFARIGNLRFLLLGLIRPLQADMDEPN